MSAKSWYKKRYTPEQIKEIQRTLGVEEDGIIGPDTLRAIKEYQADAGLKADGLWGKATQAKADEWNDEYNSFVPNRSASNYNEELYKEYADNLEKKYYQDEQKKYESNFLPNYEMSNAELAYLNKEIDKVKKQLAARQSKYEEVPQPKTQVGWSSYIVNNDRGMLDKYQDAERQWYTLKEQERHAKELADKQRIQQDLLNMDEIQKNRSIAAINYQYAQQALKLDNSGDPNIEAMLEQKEAEAKATLDYWNKRYGYSKKSDDKELKDDVKTEVEASKVTHKRTTSRAVDMADMDAYISGKKKFATIKEHQDFINRAKADPSYNVEGDYRTKVNDLEAVKSTEAINAAKAEQLKKAQAVYSKLSKIEKANYLDEHPEYDSVDGKLKYKSK